MEIINRMKRLVTLLIFLTVAICVSAQKQNYVVGFYNVENLFDIYDDPAKNDEQFLPEGSYNWNQDKYQKKLSNIARVISEIKKEAGAFHTILGVCEIENRRVLEDLVKHKSIAGAGYKIVHYESPDRRGIDVGLLYRPDQFTYLDSETLPFVFEGTKVAITLSKEEQDDFRTRDALMVHGLIDGEHVAVYVAHLPSRVGGKGEDLRPLGAEIIYKHAQKMEKKYPGIKIIVMGDMNDNPTDESMTKWMHGKENIKDVKKGDFFSPFTEVLEDGTGTLSYQGTWNIYDLILVNKSLTKAKKNSLVIKKIDGYYGQVFDEDFLTQQSGKYKGTPFRTFSNGAFINGYSDHYPTYIIIGK